MSTLSTTKIPPVAVLGTQVRTTWYQVPGTAFGPRLFAGTMYRPVLAKNPNRTARPTREIVPLSHLLTVHSGLRRFGSLELDELRYLALVFLLFTMSYFIAAISNGGGAPEQAYRKMQAAGACPEKPFAGKPGSVDSISQLLRHARGSCSLIEQCGRGLTAIISLSSNVCQILLTHVLLCVCRNVQI